MRYIWNFMLFSKYAGHTDKNIDFYYPYFVWKCLLFSPCVLDLNITSKNKVKLWHFVNMAMLHVFRIFLCWSQKAQRNWLNKVTLEVTSSKMAKYFYIKMSCFFVQFAFQCMINLHNSNLNLNVIIKHMELHWFNVYINCSNFQ